MPRQKIKIPEDFAAYADSHSIDEAMKHYKVSKTTIQHWRAKVGLLKRMGAKYPNAVPEQFKGTRDEFVDYCSSHTVYEVSEEFGVTIRSAAKWKMQYGIEFKSRLNVLKHTDETKRMIALLAWSFPYASVGAVFGISSERVRQIKEEIDAITSEEK